MNNIFADLPKNLEQEVIELLASSETIRIERIISKGQTTKIGEWYDQSQDEWVLVLKGEALLSIEGREIIRLTEGSYINIPAHQKHRVDWTDPTQETLWLAIYY
ncbi:cupin domain-containing protein [Acaryochloris sp. IP29b_bin.137]|uniref:cupin domain-containing protein n=1 Tax=Acaryochloris sp. IP29b_bin.137 TaxID=2969217 RepID=UPI00260A2295|nr:cupin domain-containing protein [Acaryochloris sp. IP29b_bin.137]